MQEIDEFVEEKLTAWKVDYRNRRIAWIISNKIENTGNLSKNIDGEVRKEPGEVTVDIIFPEHGRYIDMKAANIKNVIPGKGEGGQEAIRRVIEWIKKRGVEKFAPGQLKRRGRLPSNETLLTNNIAWGIMVNRAKGKFRRRPWYAKTTAAAVTELYNDVAGGLLDVAAENILQDLKQ